MRLPLLALPVLLVGALVVPASAARATCPLVSDARGDTTLSPFQDDSTPADQVGYRPGDDLLAADVWADRKALHAVTRLVAVPGGPEDPSPEAQGYWWITDIDHGTTEITLDVMERSGSFFPLVGYGTVHSAGDDSGGASAVSYTTVSGATVAINRRARTVRVDVPLTAFPEEVPLAAGTRWVKVDVGSFALNGPPVVAVPGTTQEGTSGEGEQRDHATTSRPVVIGSPDCAGRL